MSEVTLFLFLQHHAVESLNIGETQIRAMVFDHIRFLQTRPPIWRRSLPNLTNYNPVCIHMPLRMHMPDPLLSLPQQQQREHPNCERVFNETWNMSFTVFVCVCQRPAQGPPSPASALNELELEFGSGSSSFTRLRLQIQFTGMCTGSGPRFFR